MTASKDITGKSTSVVNPATEGSNFFKNIWFPYFGAGIGLCLGTLFAWRKGSGTLGFLGWSSLGMMVGTGVTIPIVIKRVTSQAESLGNKLNTVAAKPNSPATKSTKILSVDELKKIVAAEMVKDGEQEPKVSNLLKTLTDNEVKAIYLMSKLPKDPNDTALQKRFPELFKTKPTNEEEGKKHMGLLVEKIQGDYGISGLSGADFIANAQSGMKKMFGF